MIALSTFSGVGGLDLGLARAGITHAAFAELDPWRRDVLAAHWPGRIIYPDVRDVAANAAGRSVVGHVDLLCGGFPCQDLSVGGKRAGLAGARSGLFHEFARIADAIRPRWIMLENVPGLLSSNDGRDMGTVVGTLADIGYGVAWRILDAQHFGVPQRRRRVFIVGHLGGDDGRALRAICEGCSGHPAPRRCSWTEATAGTAGSPGSPDRYYVEDHVNGTLRANGANGGPPRTDKQPLVVSNTLKGQRGKGGGGLGPEETLVAGTLTVRASNGTGHAPDERTYINTSTSVRRLTPIECERLMGWPDNWTQPEGMAAPDSRRFAACGDGVVANVAEWIAHGLLAESA